MKSMVSGLAFVASALAIPTGAAIAAEAAAQDAPARAAAAKPKLVVVIVVDQMRADYLERYGEFFSGGLARLQREGRWFRSAWADHGATNSLPGHTTVMTGTIPAHHGIVDNYWTEWVNGERDDRSGFSLVDREDGAPYALDATTISEWFMSADAASRFVALGSNDAAKIYPGQLRGDVYWFDDSLGYRTNANYRAELPDWVRRFNASQVRGLANSEWTSSLPPALVARLRADASSFENGGEDTAFPHRRQTDEEAPFAFLHRTPMVDRLTLELAANAVAKRRLGQDEHIDLLAISLTSLDEIGHAFGPLSHEQADAVMRLDRNLGTFFDALDRSVGPDGWAVALTADHGVTITPEQRRLWGSAQGRRVSIDEAREVIAAAYDAADKYTGREDRARAAAEAVSRFDFIARAYTESEVAAAEPGIDSHLGLLARSYRAGRVPLHPFYFRGRSLSALGLYVVLQQDIMMNWATAIHGSTYDDDRRVPLLIRAPGVSPGASYARAATIDVAPTMAMLAGIAAPEQVDGRDLLGDS